MTIKQLNRTKGLCQQSGRQSRHKCLHLLNKHVAYAINDHNHLLKGGILKSG